MVWRLGGARAGAYRAETFSAGSDAQNLARADGFQKMVDAAGQHWPDGWVRGEGFMRQIVASLLGNGSAISVRSGCSPGHGSAARCSSAGRGPERRFLTEAELATAARLAGPFGDLLVVAVGTGMRFGEIGALWSGTSICAAAPCG